MMVSATDRPTAPAVITVGTTIAGATTVYDSIRGPAMYTGVFPMLVHGEWMRVASQVRRLRDLVDRVRALERKTKADDDGR